KQTGETCAGNNECVSDFCVPSGSSKICVPACGAGGSCPSGFACSQPSNVCLMGGGGRGRAAAPGPRGALHPRPALPSPLRAPPAMVRAAAVLLRAAGCAPAAPGADTEAIVNGSSDAGKDPAVVLIHLINSRGGEIANCTGALIAPRVVITAAHCANGSLGDI